MRILIAVKPRMYRESLAINLHGRRPDFEIMLAPTASLDGQAEGFRPDLLIGNDTDGVDVDFMEGIRCRIELLYSDGMDARVSLDGEVWNITDVLTEDLVEIADQTEKLMLEGMTFG